MAEEQQAQERTEEPTGKRLQQAREKGQVARSRELNTLLMLLPCSIVLWIWGGFGVNQLALLAEEALTPSLDVIYQSRLLAPFFADIALRAFTALVPFFAFTLLVALIGPASMGGLVFSAQALSPSLEKLDPIKGLGRLFALKSLVELLKTLLKFFVVAGMGIAVLSAVERQVLGLITLPVDRGIAEAGSLIMMTLVLVSTALIIIAAVDVPFQLWNHNKQLKMTKQEVRDEMKETDGRPEVKGRIRQLQRENAQRRMMQDIPTADVVITNPTHFAVALKYDQMGSGAPRVVAKGVDHVAFQIRQIAEHNEVVIYEEPPLARALYASTEIGDDIPQSLFLAVARVLAYVYHLRRAAATEYVPRPKPLDLPEEFRHVMKEDMNNGN